MSGTMWIGKHAYPHGPTHAPMDIIVMNENLEKEEFTRGKARWHWGPGRTLKGTKMVAIPRSSELWSAKAAILH